MKTFLPLDIMTLHCDSGSRHDFPRLARESGFSFNLYRGRVDWTKIGTIDVDKIIREKDLETLQDALSCVMSCSLNSEYDLKVLDPNFIKIFQLAQLGADFLLYCRNYLDHCVIVMQEQLRVALQEIEQLRKLKQQNSEEISILQRKLKTKSKSLRSYDNSPVPNFKCSGCEKVFVGEQYLLAHQQRRHPELVNFEPFKSNQSREVGGLKQQIHDLQARLQATEEALKQKQDSFIPDVAALQAMLQSELKKIAQSPPLSTMADALRADDPPQPNQSKADAPIDLLQAELAQVGGQDKELQTVLQSSEQEKLKHDSTQSVLLVQVNQQNDEIKALKEQLQLQNQTHELIMQRHLEELQRLHQADLEDLRLSILESKGSSQSKTVLSSLHDGISTVNSPQPSMSQGAIQAWDKPVSKAVKGSEKEISNLLVHEDKSVETHQNTAVDSSVEKSKLIKPREESVIREEYVSPVDQESSASSSLAPSPELVTPLHTGTKNKQGEKSPSVDYFNNTKNTDTLEHSKSMYGKSSSSNSGSSSETGSSSYDSESQSTNSEQESSTKENESRALKIAPQVFDGLKEDLLGLLNRRLRELGVDPEWEGLPVASFHSNLATVKHHQNIAAKSQNNYHSIQEALLKEVDKRVAEHLKSQQSTPSSVRTKEKRTSGSFSIFARIKSHVKKLSSPGQSSRILKYPKKSTIDLKTGDLVENVYSQEPTTSDLKPTHEFELLPNKSMLSDTPEQPNNIVSKDNDVESSQELQPTSLKPVAVSVDISDSAYEDSRDKMKPILQGASTTNVKVYSRSMYANLNRSDIEVEKKDLPGDLPHSVKQPAQLKTSTPIKSVSESSSKPGGAKLTFVSSDIESISEVESDLHDIIQNTNEELTAPVKTRPHTTRTTAELLANVAKFRQNSGQPSASQSSVKSNLKSSLSTGNIMKKKVVFRDEKDGFNTIELGPAHISNESLTPQRSLSENSLVMIRSSPPNSSRPVAQPRSSLMPPTVPVALTSAADTDSEEDWDWDWDRDSSGTFIAKKTEAESPKNSGGHSYGGTKRSELSFVATNDKLRDGGSDSISKISDLAKEIERKLQNHKGRPSFGVSIAGPKPSELATNRPSSRLGVGAGASASSTSYYSGGLPEDKLSDLLLDDLSSS